MQPRYTPMVNSLTLPELLEHMLLFVDMRTLLTSAQRVCRQWHEVINLSQSIQQALFFLPVQPNPDNKKQERVRNPLLGDAFWSLALPWDGERWDKPHGPAWYLPSDNQDLKRRLGQGNSSWRRMLIQQPPTSKIGIIRGYHPLDIQFDTTHWQFTIEPNQDHLRMDSVVTGLQSMAIKPCRSTRWAFWDVRPTKYLGLLGNFAQVLLDAALKECDIAIIAYDEDAIIHPLFKYFVGQADHGVHESILGKQFALGFSDANGTDTYSLADWLKALHYNAEKQDPVLGGSTDFVRKIEGLC